MKKYTIGMLVSNQFGVLTRISGMFGRRGFNIDSLVVGVTEDPARSRMTITVTGEDTDRDQIIKQLEKLQDVFVVREMIPEKIVSRELILIKVSANSETRQEIIDAVNVFRNKIIDYTPDSLCIEATGETSKIEAFLELMRRYGIIELCRTGLVSLDRGTKSLGAS
ncbi:MAG: acetolactate synthase small subunit [Ruminococcaceae bacterium]|nr:acetolactate synthase small subunit [Oscillospiraceae bacterium]